MPQIDIQLGKRPFVFFIGSLYVYFFQRNEETGK